MKKIITSILLIPSMVMSTFGLFLLQPALVSATDTNQTCNVITLVSSSNTMTAGYTETNASSTPLSTSAYSFGSYMPATSTQTVIPPWVDPTIDSNFATSGAVWISTAPSWPGGTGNTEGLPANNQWRLFKDSFTIPAGATTTSADVWYTADNATALYLNGSFVANTGGGPDDVFGPVPGALPPNYSNVFHSTISPVIGSNTINFVVRNWGGNFSQNPTGLLYKVVVNYCVPNPTTPSTVKVTIDKYIDGKAASTTSATASFPMTAIWNATNIGSGSGSFSLSPVGFNSPNPYEAVTANMSSGASYSTSENLGTTCAASNPYALIGYSSGPTLAAALSGTVSTVPPSFTNMTGNEYVIVWNKSCVPTQPGGEPGDHEDHGQEQGDINGGGNSQGDHEDLKEASTTPPVVHENSDHGDNGHHYAFGLQNGNGEGNNHSHNGQGDD